MALIIEGANINKTRPPPAIISIVVGDEEILFAVVASPDAIFKGAIATFETFFNTGAIVFVTGAIAFPTGFSA
jgi:hypothetical protein